MVDLLGCADFDCFVHLAGGNDHATEDFALGLHGDKIEQEAGSYFVLRGSIRPVSDGASLLRIW